MDAREYPAPLAELVRFFESLPEGERRDNLIDLAEASASVAPSDSLAYEIRDVRKDPECTDTVGVFLRADAAGRVSYALTLGPKVQTLTRAMATILCRGLNGASLEEVIGVGREFVPRIVGEELVRLRSRTVYYVLSRMQEAARKLREKRAQT